jgi:hypothetical protein
VGYTEFVMARSPLSAAAAAGRERRPAKEANRRMNTIDRVPVFWPPDGCVRFDIEQWLAGGIQRLIAPEGGHDP